MTAAERAQTIAERVAENKIFTAVARVAMTASVVIGAPFALWLVTTTNSHSLSLADVRGDMRLHNDRIARLELADQRDRERAERDVTRLNTIDRLLGQIEERTQSLIRDMDAIRRRTAIEGHEIVR